MPWQSLNEPRCHKEHFSEQSPRIYDVTGGGILFLKHSVVDNTITYTLERTTQKWSVGYYLNDAYLRLLLLNQLRTRHSMTVRPEQSKPIDSYFSALVDRCGVDTLIGDRWTDAFNVALSVFRDLELQADANNAP